MDNAYITINNITSDDNVCYDIINNCTDIVNKLSIEAIEKILTKIGIKYRDENGKLLPTYMIHKELKLRNLTLECINSFGKIQLQIHEILMTKKVLRFEYVIDYNVNGDEINTNMYCLQY